MMVAPLTVRVSPAAVITRRASGSKEVALSRIQTAPAGITAASGRWVWA